MEVIFHRTGARRYAVRATSANSPTLEMDPAPGYDDRMPHDLFHFVVEAELGLSHGIFGQLAAGGDAGTFYLAPAPRRSRQRSRHQRRVKKRGRSLAAQGRTEAEMSERAVGIFEHEWPARRSVAHSSAQAKLLSKSAERILARCSDAERELFSEVVIRRVCERLDQASAEWARLAVGESMTMRWQCS